MALNDDLSLSLTVHQVAETRSIIDCSINDPDAILQIMFSGRHISVNWTIMGLCYLMNGLNNERSSFMPYGGPGQPTETH